MFCGWTNLQLGKVLGWTNLLTIFKFEVYLNLSSMMAQSSKKVEWYILLLKSVCKMKFVFGSSVQSATNE